MVFTPRHLNTIAGKNTNAKILSLWSTCLKKWNRGFTHTNTKPVNTQCPDYFKMLYRSGKAAIMLKKNPH